MREDVARQVKGNAQTLMGRIKEGFNRLFGSHRGEIEGRLDEMRGRANVQGGAAQGKIQEAGGSAKETAKEKVSEIGEKLGSEKEKLEGRAKDLQEKAQQQLHH